MVQTIAKKYEDWDLHHEAEVQFEEAPPAREQVRGQSQANETITLEITDPVEAEHEVWDFYSVTPVQVKICISQLVIISILVSHAYGVHVFWDTCLMMESKHSLSLLLVLFLHVVFDRFDNTHCNG